MMTNFKIINIVLFISLFIFACSSSNNGSSNNYPLTGTKWSLYELKGIGVENSQYKKEIPFIIFKSDVTEFSGYGGCNNMFGKFYFNSDTLIIRNIASTKMYCGDKNIEMEFFKVLKQSVTFKIKENILMLSDTAQVPILKFKQSD